MFIIAVIMILTITAIMLSPKLRAKLMKRQVKTMKYFAEDTKDNLTDLANAQADVMEESKDSLKKMADINANVNKDAVEKTTAAISKGIKKNNK